MKKIYLDYAATTLVDPAVFAAMKPYFENSPAHHARQRAGAAGWGNASSLHSFGQEAMAALDDSREKIGRAIGAQFREVIFTGSATESNNLALRGVIRAAIQNSNPKNQNGKSKFKIITTNIEHESILETCRDLEKEGIEIIYLPVNREGLVDLKKLEKSLDERTILVSVMYANNEIGTIEPIQEIAGIIADFRKRSVMLKHNTQRGDKSRGEIYRYPITKLPSYPLFHTDAVQAFQYLDCDVEKLGMDLMTLSAHKIYGPKGVGALFMKHETYNMKHKQGDMLHAPGYMLHPLVTGGGQEYGLRSGTENIPAIVGFARAVELVSNSRELANKKTTELRDYFWKEIKKIFPKAQLNGSDLKNRLPNNLNVYFPGHKAEDLLIKLDLAGVAVSAGSACSARGTEPSHVLQACGFPLSRIKSSLRITIGRPTTKSEINEAVKRMKKVLSSSPV